MNDTPQGDGNPNNLPDTDKIGFLFIRMNDTPQGDGNFQCVHHLAVYTYYKNE